MLRRKIDDRLAAWLAGKKDGTGSNVVVVEGIRRTGKSTSVRTFARKNFKKVIWLDFLGDPKAKDIIGKYSDVEYMNLLLATAYRTELVDEDSVIVLDHMEAVDVEALQRMLDLYRKDGKYAVIAITGEGVIRGERDWVDTRPWIVGEGPAEELQDIPVLTLHALDFEEFLWAEGISDEQIEMVRTCLKSLAPVPATLHKKLQELVNVYIVVGGFPEVVNVHLGKATTSKIREIQQEYLPYVDEILHHHYSNINRRNMLAILKSMPEHFRGKNRKFQLKRIEPGATNRKYERSLDWLDADGYLRRNYNLTEPYISEDTVIDSQFEAYLPDIGWYLSTLPADMPFVILKDNLGANDWSVLNALLADFQIKAGRQMHYYRRRSGMTLDFVVPVEEITALPEEVLQQKTEQDGAAAPATGTAADETGGIPYSIAIEAKFYGNSKAVRTIIADEANEHVVCAIAFGHGNIEILENQIVLPWYMGYFLFT